MGIFFVYILKSAFSLALFYLFYRLLLNRDTFYHFNRIMLLVLMLLSCLLPFIETSTESTQPINQPFLDIEDLILMQAVSVVSYQEEVPTLSWYEIVVLIYWAGILFFIIRNINSIIKIYSIVRSSKRAEIENGIKLIIHTKNIAPFSWMKYIVISQKDYEENGKEIIIHEMAHIAHHHSYDVMLADLFVFLQWFNPASWLLKQELQNIHEYQADESVLRSGVNAKDYQLLLIKKAVGEKRFSIANNFNHSSLKKRITMMLRKKSNPWARMKYSYVLPVAALAVSAFARPEVKAELNNLSNVDASEVTSTIKEEIKMIDNTQKLSPATESETTVIKDNEIPAQKVSASQDNNKFVLTGVILDDDDKPLCGASIIIEGTTNGTLSGLDGEFELNANEGDVVWVSYIGKETLKFPVKEKMKNKKMNFTLYDKIVKGEEIVVVGYGENKDNVEAVIGLTNNNTKASKKSEEEIVFRVVEEMPEYPGGMAECLKFLGKNVRYPLKAQQNKVEGRVIVQFVVDKDGSIKNSKTVRSVSPELDAEALRVINMMPKWKPGMQRNHAVSVLYTLPVSFRLQEPAQNSGNNTLKLPSISSLRGAKKPLIIVDDKEISPESMEKLDQSKIESIEVIKDASAEKFRAKYGDKVKDGIIIIKMKK